MKLPDQFINRMEGMLGEEAQDFLTAMQENPSVSIKLNRRKTLDPSVTGYEGLTPVSWCDSGYYIPERPKFTLNPLLHAGVFYVQDASSMVYETIAEKIIPAALDTGNPLRILDMCAAPGGKTTSLINALPDGSIVVANEFVGSRASVLYENLTKWGYPDFVVTNSPTSAFTRLGEVFDIVAVDAPCSGEGMMRKEEVAVSQWNEGLIKLCADLQREILDNAISVLKPGGFLIYSTCTFNTVENEDNLRWLAEDKGLIPVDMRFPPEWGISEGIDTPYPCMRFMPHKTRGEGLFVAVLRKEGDYPRARVLSQSGFMKLLKASVKVIAEGIPLTTLKGKDHAPSSESVLATNFTRDSLPEIEVDENTALSYLRHEALRLPENIGRGFVTIKYKGFPLGLVKNIGNRANNLYPSRWRIKFL